MAHKHRSKILALSLIVLLGIYVGAYFSTTEVFHGRLNDGPLDDTHYRIRLFHSVWHMRIFSPLLTVEQLLRPAKPEFSGQVRSGASLPPPDDDEK
jgi:hypothetical protein